MANTSNYPQRYMKGVWLFNHRYFFECHEILEEQWKESVGIERLFYQTLIHAAVAFVHWETGNRKGVFSLHHTFKLKAASVQSSTYQGLDIRRLEADMDALIVPLRENIDLPLLPLKEIETPTLHVAGFEPVACDEHELLVLGRDVEEEEE